MNNHHKHILKIEILLLIAMISLLSVVNTTFASHQHEQTINARFYGIDFETSQAKDTEKTPLEESDHVSESFFWGIPNLN